MGEIRCLSGKDSVQGWEGIGKQPIWPNLPYRTLLQALSRDRKSVFFSPFMAKWEGIGVNFSNGEGLEAVPLGLLGIEVGGIRCVIRLSPPYILG